MTFTGIQKFLNDTYSNIVGTLCYLNNSTNIKIYTDVYIDENNQYIKTKEPTSETVNKYDTQTFEIEEINTMLALMKTIEDSWSDKQRFTIWDMEQNGGSQEECAKRMNTTQSTIARRLAEGNYLTYERAKKTVEKAFRRLQT